MFFAGGHEKRMEQVGKDCTLELGAAAVVQIKFASQN
jgi:hypothetical protein